MQRGAWDGKEWEGVESIPPNVYVHMQRLGYCSNYVFAWIHKQKIKCTYTEKGFRSV